MLVQVGYTQLVNMVPGMLGAKHAPGATQAPGWIPCGLPTSVTSSPERTWAVIERGL
jgi:hypothetical protein